MVTVVRMVFVEDPRRHSRNLGVIEFTKADSEAVCKQAPLCLIILSHSGIRIPNVQRLPAVYICNNNQNAYSTPLNLQLACTNEADRGPAYNTPAEIVDGPDVLAVYEATQRAAAYAHTGSGSYRNRREADSGNASVSPGVES